MNSLLYKWFLGTTNTFTSSRPSVPLSLITEATYSLTQEELPNYAASAFQRINNLSRNPGKTVPLTQITRTIYVCELEFQFDPRVYKQRPRHIAAGGGVAKLRRTGIKVMRSRCGIWRVPAGARCWAWQVMQRPGGGSRGARGPLRG